MCIKTFNSLKQCKTTQIEQTNQRGIWEAVAAKYLNNRQYCQYAWGPLNQQLPNGMLSGWLGQAEWLLIQWSLWNYWREVGWVIRRTVQEGTRNFQTQTWLWKWTIFRRQCWRQPLGLITDDRANTCVQQDLHQVKEPERILLTQSSISQLH